MLKMKRVGHKGSRKGKSKSKRGSRERTAARKERKATQTLAIVLGETEIARFNDATKVVLVYMRQTSIHKPTLHKSFLK